VEEEEKKKVETCRPTDILSILPTPVEKQQEKNEK